MKNSQRKYKHAPRLKDKIREGHEHTFDPLVYVGLQAIAKKEKKSVSWVVDEVMIDYFSLKHSKYRRQSNGS